MFRQTDRQINLHMCFGIPVLNGRTPVDRWTTWRHTGRSESVPQHSWASWWVVGTSGCPTSRLVGDKKQRTKKRPFKEKCNASSAAGLAALDEVHNQSYFQLVEQMSAAKDTTVFGFDSSGLRISTYLMRPSSSVLEVQCYPGCQQNNRNIFSSIPVSISICNQVTMGKCKEEQGMRQKPPVLTTTAASCVKPVKQRTAPLSTFR